MPTYNRERETEAAHALTHNQEVWSGQGWAVVTAGGLTAGSNALQLDVGSYEVLTGGTSTVSVGPTTIDAQLPDSDPYWLVVYVDGSGALQTAAGPEGAVAPGLGVDVREISSPPPPTLAAVGPVTVLGRVLVTDDGIADPRIDDRVFGGDRVFDAIDARTVEAGSVDTKLLSSQTNQQPFITQPGGEVSVEQYVVSTTTTDILGAGGSAAVLFVAGQRQGSNETFVDVLIAIQSGGGGAKVIGSDEFGTNPTRTYGNVTGTIPMSLSSGTYDVSVTSFVLVA